MVELHLRLGLLLLWGHRQELHLERVQPHPRLRRLQLLRLWLLRLEEGQSFPWHRDSFGGGTASGGQRTRRGLGGGRTVRLLRDRRRRHAASGERMGRRDARAG